MEEACREFAGHIIVGIDAKDGMVATHGWANVTDVKATDLAKRFADAGRVEHCLYRYCPRWHDAGGECRANGKFGKKYGGLPVIASGGVTDLQDIENLKPYGEYLAGIITGRAIYEGTLDIATAQKLLDS